MPEDVSCLVAAEGAVDARAEPERAERGRLLLDSSCNATTALLLVQTPLLPTFRAGGDGSSELCFAPVAAPFG